jgi:hypothetical protein
MGGGPSRLRVNNAAAVREVVLADRLRRRSLRRRTQDAGLKARSYKVVVVRTWGAGVLRPYKGNLRLRQDARKEEGSLRCVARRAKTARRKRPGHSGRDDGFQ